MLIIVVRLLPYKKRISFGSDGKIHYMLYPSLQICSRAQSPNYFCHGWICCVSKGANIRPYTFRDRLELYCQNVRASIQCEVSGSHSNLR